MRRWRLERGFVFVNHASRIVGTFCSTVKYESIETRVVLVMKEYSFIAVCMIEIVVLVISK